jgi:hypothetical protein
MHSILYFWMTDSSNILHECSEFSGPPEQLEHLVNEVST